MDVIRERIKEISQNLTYGEVVDLYYNNSELGDLIKLYYDDIYEGFSDVIKEIRVEYKIITMMYFTTYKDLTTLPTKKKVYNQFFKEKIIDFTEYIGYVIYAHEDKYSIFLNMKNKLVPIDCDTDQDKLAMALAQRLCLSGVSDVMALPLAIAIMGACQRFVDGNLELALQNLRD